MKLHVDPKEILKAKPIDTQAISWLILEQKAGCIEDTMSEDAAPRNVGLRILEDALDWRIGLAFVRLMKAVPKGKMLKPFTMEVTRHGISAILPSGKAIQLEG